MMMYITSDLIVHLRNANESYDCLSLSTLILLTCSYYKNDIFYFLFFYANSISEEKKQTLFSETTVQTLSTNLDCPPVI